MQEHDDRSNAAAVSIHLARVLGAVLLLSGLLRLFGSELPDLLLVDWNLQWPAPRLVGLVELVVGASLMVPTTAVPAALVGASLLSGAVIIDGYRGEFAPLPIVLGSLMLGIAAGYPALFRETDEPRSLSPMPEPV